MSDSTGAPNDGPGGGSGGEARVLLLVGHDENRRLLAEWLSARHEVVPPDAADGTDPLDLCIVDAPGLDEREGWLRERKAAAHPHVLPVLLVVSGDDQPRRHRGGGDRPVAEEVITTPVRKAELRARIDGLLERRALSIERSRSEAKFRTLFEATPDPIVVVDGDGCIQHANDAFAGVADAATLVGEPIEAITAFPPEVVERLSASADAPDGLDAPYTTEYNLPGGETRFAEVNTAALPGDSAGTINVFRDVTDRARSRRELERQNERLDEFATVLAHEIRNPLNIAAGFLESIEGGDEDALERVEAAHARIGRMVDELLALARQGEFVGEFEPVSIGAVAEEAWASVVAPEATLAVEAEGTIVADRDRLTDALANLFGNAIEHGAADTTVRVGWTEDGEGFYVEDDGPGVPEGEREKVFGSGYTTDPEGSGTGFGLAIVRQIVDAHGWDIDVREGSDGGARFEITGIASSDIRD